MGPGAEAPCRRRGQTRCFSGNSGHAGESRSVKVQANPSVPHEISGPRTKPPSAELLAVTSNDKTSNDQTKTTPKLALPARAERATVRLQLEFSDAGLPALSTLAPSKAERQCNAS